MPSKFGFSAAKRFIKYSSQIMFVTELNSNEQTVIVKIFEVCKLNIVYEKENVRITMYSAGTELSMNSLNPKLWTGVRALVLFLSSSDLALARFNMLLNSSCNNFAILFM